MGTTKEDVVFEIIDNEYGDSVYNPSYPASSKQSIRFQFTPEGTSIQPGGSLWFTLPSLWSSPSTTDRTGTATVYIITKDDDDGEDKLVTQLPEEDTADMKAGDIMKLEAGVRRVTLMIGKSGGLAEGGEPVRIQYGTADLTKKPVAISTRAEGTPESDEDGLSIRGYFKVSGERGFRQRDAGTIWVDITNVEDGTGTASITPSPALVRAGSKKNLITVTYTGTGTMDGGAVRFNHTRRVG